MLVLNENYEYTQAVDGTGQAITTAPVLQSLTNKYYAKHFSFAVLSLDQNAFPVLHETSPALV